MIEHTAQLRVDGIALSTNELDAFASLAKVGVFTESRALFPKKENWFICLFERGS